MRETRLQAVNSKHSTGITPAYAGNTSPVVAISSSIKDHPRVCGKHSYSLSRYFATKGSPPRMRETHSANWRYNRKCRITPAYAGNTCIRKSSKHTRVDHPRVCGKHNFSAGGKKDHGGSPPRMRETLSVTFAEA